PWLTDNGGIDWSADVTLSSAAAPANTFGGRRELLSNHIPLHNHGATTKLTWYNTWYNGGGSTTMNAWDRATSTGSPLSLGTHTGTAAPGANVAPYWGVAVANFTRTTQYAPISTEFIVDKDKLKAAITSPSGTINDPSLTGNTNQAVSDATGLSAVASGTINGATDNTLQPYITCYMYRRTALGKLN
ncbi:MAG: hypothetical protein FWC27_05485, partial [Firmicutes bacterium]|nr:hypothetical protein [Bacillota bacterium]